MSSSTIAEEDTGPVETLDSVYEKIGHGKIQRLIAYVCAVSRNSGAFFAYCFAYLILEQKFLCTDNSTINSNGDHIWKECSAEYICGMRQNVGDGNMHFSYKVDTSYEYYIKNWYTEMDLMCTSSSVIGIMYSQFFIGTVMGGCLAFLPDRVGRKKSVIGGMFVSLIAQSVMLFVPNFLVRTVCFWLIGFSNLKNS